MRIAEVYHQETKYHEREMFRHTRRLDFSRQPLSYKTYQSGQQIMLAPYLASPSKENSGDPEEKTAPFSKGQLARLLHATNGITGLLQYADGPSMTLRAAPTAGGLYPTEIYVATRAVPYLTDGIYNFQVHDHSLVLVWEGNFWPSIQKYCMEHEAIASSHLLMILTGVYERSTWRYAERAYRRILLDTGHILGNITAYAHEAGWNPYPLGGFLDNPLNTLFFLDPLQEGVLTVVALPRQNAERSLQPTVPLAIPSLPNRSETTSPKTRALQLHFASSLTKEGPHEEASSSPSITDFDLLPASDLDRPLPSLSLTWPDGVSPTIRTRRSTRQFTGEAFMQEELGAILEYAYAPVLSPDSFFFCPSLLTTYLVCQKISGVQPGVYRYNPIQKTVTPLKAGQFCEVSCHFCLGQELARDAAALVIHTTHLPTALNCYGDRVYRYLHMDAGHLGERINLAAIHMGLGVSGIGGFYDDEVNALLDLSLDSIIVYITTLGRRT